MLFENPETHSKAVITTSTLSDKATLYVFLQHPSGSGEENKPLDSCFENSKIKPEFLNEIVYFTRMLELFSDMCTGRNYICKASIKDWFPIQVLVSNIWNEQLSPDIRAAFMKLMLNMHVDSQPREEIKKPELIRVLGWILKEDQKLVHRQRHSIVNLDTGMDISRSMNKRFTHMTLGGLSQSENTEEFIVRFVEDEIILYQLKENVLMYLKEEGKSPNFNILTHQVLKMGRKLAKFEVLGAACSNSKEGYCVLSPEHELFSPDKMDLIRLLKVAKPLLLHGYKKDLIRVNKIVPRNSKTSKKTQEPFESLLNKLLQKVNSLGDPMVHYSENLRNYLRSSPQTNDFNEDDRTCETKCKTEICQLLHYVMDWRQDYLLNNIVMWFNTVYLERPIEGETEIKELLPPVIVTQKVSSKNGFLSLINLSRRLEIAKEKPIEFKPFIKPEIQDLSCISPKIISKLLKIFCVSTDYKMQSLIVNLVLRSFNQRTELLKNIKKLHVMTLLNDTEIFTWTKASVYTFKQLTEQSELWLKYWMQSPFLMEKNIEKIEKVQKILDKLSIVMYNDTYIEDGMPQAGEKKVIQKDKQFMCYHLYLHDYIIHLLRDGMYTLSEIYNDPKSPKESEARNRLIKLFQFCFKVLSAMTKNNLKVQKRLYGHLNIITEFIHIPLGQVDLICEIFRDNQPLCSSVKEDFLKIFLDLIISEGRQARLLRVFEIIQSPNGVPLPDIQRMVLLLLLNPATIHHVCYLDKEATSFSFEHMPAPPLFSSHYMDEPIVYHANLIKVLTKCGHGASGVYLTEAKCQKIISIPQIFDLLNKDDIRYEILQIPLLDFFFHIYLDSEQRVEDLENSKDFLKYIEKAASSLQKVTKSSQINIELFEIWMKILHAYSEKYIQAFQAFEFHEDVDLLCNYLEVLLVKWEMFLNLPISEETCNIIDDLGLRYNYFYTKPILIDELNCVNETTGDITKAKDRWTEFKNIALYSDSLKTMLSEEHSALYTLVFDIESIDPSMTPGVIFQKMINFVKHSNIYKPPLNVLTSVLMFLSAVLSNPKVNKDENKQDVITRLQDDFCEYGAVKVLLSLLCDKDTKEIAFNSLLFFAIRLLEGGNEKAQQSFYQFFITTSTSYVLFEKLANCINEYIDKISYETDKGRLPIYRHKDLKANNIMKFFQLLCENHNYLLQNYLRVQTNLRNNIDMVAVTILLLEGLMKKKNFSHFLIISQCFDTLTEFIQGPCRENQKAIIDSKFLEVASGLLSLDEKVDSLNKYDTLGGEGLKSPTRNDGCLKGWMIAHLKYKCMITIQSLLEGQIDNYVITRMIRALNIEIFKENLISIYLSYISMYNKGYYDYPLFMHYEGNDEYAYGEVNDQDTNSEKYQFIIEVGFLIYHVMSCFKDNDDPENKAIIENELPELTVKEEANSFIAARLIGNLGKMGLSIFKSGFSVVARIAKGKKSKIAMSEEDRKKILDEAYSFFQVNSGNIEVIFTDQKLFKVYFWIPPECHHLTEENKEIFHNNVDRSSDKAKVQYFMQKAGDMIEEMQHEFRLSKFYNKYKGISFLTSHVTVWKELAFTMTILLNFFIIASFYEDPTGNRNSPQLFYGNTGGLSLSSTSNAIRILGLIQCVCSILIVTFFIIKTAPILIQRGWRKHITNTVSTGCLSTMYSKIKGFFLTLYFTLSNVDVLYNLLYMSFSILGIAGFTLFFSLHLLDVIYRFPSLQNVIMSIVLPRKSLILTFILILILIYLFSIWAFLGFYNFYDGNCNSMIMCIKTTFDQGIKNGGGIGQYLDESGGPIANSEIFIRFLFDDLFNIIVMIIMMNIIQGIIIDTFAVLREETERNTADRETKCFICGKEKDFIERCTNRPFRYHTVYEHNEWNYIFFIAYLRNKESTEHTGIESSIFDLIKEKDISWIPQQEGLTLKDIESTDELQLFQKIENISNTYENIQKEMRDMKKYFSDYLESKQIISG